jgi:hypothetical protein
VLPRGGTLSSYMDIFKTVTSIQGEGGCVLFPVSLLCCAVQSHRGQAKTRGTVAFFGAKRTLTRRSFTLPETQWVGNKRYIAREEIPKLLRGLVVDRREQRDVIGHMRLILGDVATNQLCQQITDELQRDERSLNMFSPLIRLYSETVNIASSRYEDDVFVVQLYPLLRELGYSKQKATDFFLRAAYPSILAGVPTGDTECRRPAAPVEIGDFVGISRKSAGQYRFVIVEYIKGIDGKSTPHVSAAALEFILARACSNTEQGQLILRESLELLGRKTAGDTVLAGEIIATVPDPEVAAFTLGADEASRQRIERLTLPVLHRRDQPLALESIDVSLGDLYAMAVYENNSFIAWKIGRSTDPEARAAQLDGEGERKHQKSWKHVPTEIIRGGGCLEPIVHRHFSSSLLPDFKEYFSLGEDEEAFRLLFSEAVDRAIPIWNEKQFQARKRAQSLMGDDEHAAKRQKLECDVFAYRERLSIENCVFKGLKELELATAKEASLAIQRRSSFELEADVKRLELELEICRQEHGLCPPPSSPSSVFKVSLVLERESPLMTQYFTYCSSRDSLPPFVRCDGAYSGKLACVGGPDVLANRLRARLNKEGLVACQYTLKIYL